MAHTRRIDWVILTAVWLVLGVYGADTVVATLRTENALDVPLRVIRMSQVLDVLVWIALLPCVCIAFDRWPIRMRPRATFGRTELRGALLALAARTGVLLCAGTTHGVLTWALHQTLGPLVGASPALLAHKVASIGSAVQDSLGDALLLALVYWVLHRVARSRGARVLGERTVAALRQARERALMSELQPHFLFNALNGIALLVRVDPVKAERMLVRLSTLLRDTLAAGEKSSHTLRDEVELVRRYLDVQQMRFGDRLRVRIEIPDALAAARVPSLLLQPVVENAIQHGLEGTESGGTVSISARLEASTLVLLVHNDGLPLHAPIDLACMDVTLPQGLGIGLENVRARLLLAAESAGRSLASSEQLLTLDDGVDGAGVIASLRLPYVST